jgi:hypothetical protein
MGPALHWLDALLWVNLQAALLVALLIVPAAVASMLLAGRLPVWRKGLWLGAVVVPLVLITALLLSPRPGHTQLPTRWLTHASDAGASAAVTPADRAARFIYLAWIGISLLLEIRALLHLGGILRRSWAIGDESVVALYAYLAKAAGCWRAPRLVASDEVANPFVCAGPLRGLTIVLPAPLLRLRDGRMALRAVLAHELAHARAGDPWVQLVMAFLRCVLPLPWSCGWAAARSCWEDAAEETGDLRAVRASGLRGREYATVLKDVALADHAGAAGKPCAVALAFSPQVSRFSPAARLIAGKLIHRLTGLRLADRWSEPLVVGAGACCRALVGAAMLILLVRSSAFGAIVQDPRATAIAPVISTADAGMARSAGSIVAPKAASPFAGRGFAMRPTTQPAGMPNRNSFAFHPFDPRWDRMRGPTTKPSTMNAPRYLHPRFPVYGDRFGYFNNAQHARDGQKPHGAMQKRQSNSDERSR